VSVLAKGTKREKSSFGGPLDLFWLGRAEIHFRPRAGLHILRAFRVTDPLAGLRTDLGRFYAACHFVELLTGMTREEEPLEPLYDLTRKGLARLAASDADSIPGLSCAWELRALAELGFAPSLDACVGCGRAAEAGAIRMSIRFGGVLCPDCREKDGKARTISRALLLTLRTLSRTSAERASQLRLDRRDAVAIRAFLTAFTEWRLERPLRTARFL
jgi:DNA repair protein RecO (recombination protein O)